MPLLISRQPLFDRAGRVRALDLVPCHAETLGATLGPRLATWSSASGFPLGGSSASGFPLGGSSASGFPHGGSSASGFPPGAASASGLGRARASGEADLPAVPAGPPRVVHLSEGLLLSRWAEALDPARVLPAIAATVRPDPAALRAADRLREAGFGLLLDDTDPDSDPWLRLATAVACDLATTSAGERADLVARARSRHLPCHARGVDTRADLELARAEGFELVQGLFHTLPAERAGAPNTAVAGTRAVSPPLGTAARADFEALARTVSAGGDPEALLEPFTALVAGRAPALLSTGLVRARLAELLAEEAGLVHRAPTLFTAGLCSVLDAVLDRPLADLLAELGATPAARDTLLGRPSPLNPLLYLVLAWERADWDCVEALALGVEVSLERIADPVIEALRWADERCAAAASAPRP